jgi:hypothetical protein
VIRRGDVASSPLLMKSRDTVSLMKRLPLLVDKEVDSIKGHTTVLEGEHDPVILQGKPE